MRKGGQKPPILAGLRKALPPSFSFRILIARTEKLGNLHLLYYYCNTNVFRFQGGWEQIIKHFHIFSEKAVFVQNIYDKMGESHPVLGVFG